MYIDLAVSEPFTIVTNYYVIIWRTNCWKGGHYFLTDIIGFYKSLKSSSGVVCVETISVHAASDMGT